MEPESTSVSGSDTIIGAAIRQRNDDSLLGGLTEREAQVLRMVASGDTNREVAEELILSIRTMERHVGNIYSKIGARGRVDATVFASPTVWCRTADNRLSVSRHF